NYNPSARDWGDMRPDPRIIGAAAGVAESHPERARRTLSGGVLLFRWVAFVWMAGLNLWRLEDFRRPLLAWLGVALAGVWTASLTASRRRSNDIPISSFDRNHVLGLLNGTVNFLLAGGAAGVVANHLDRSSEQLRAAIDAAIRARERAARAAERESLGRAIHDEVLQALAMVEKR